MEIKNRQVFGELTVPGDKSISHRAVMFGALHKGTTKISLSGGRRLPFYNFLLPQNGN